MNNRIFKRYAVPKAVWYTAEAMANFVAIHTAGEKPSVLVLPNYVCDYMDNFGKTEPFEHLLYQLCDPLRNENNFIELFMGEDLKDTWEEGE